MFTPSTREAQHFFAQNLNGKSTAKLRKLIIIAYQNREEKPALDNMHTYKILIIEDQQSAIDMLRTNLKDEPFELHFALNGLDGEAQFHRVEAHLLLIDINLPKLDGRTLCQRIRQHSNVPIIMLTARVDSEIKAELLGMGADDYVTKPYSPIELCARIKANLRRAYSYQEPETQNTLGGPRLVLDPTRHTVTLDGRLLALSPLEYDILYVLMSNPGWAFTRSHLLEKVWGYDGDQGEDTVTVHVSNLRQKLQGCSHLIRTIRSVGYAYEEQP